MQVFDELLSLPKLPPTDSKTATRKYLVVLQTMYVIFMLSSIRVDYWIPAILSKNYKT